MKRYLYLNVQCNLIRKYYRYTATHWLSKSLQDIPRSAFEDAMNRGILLGNSDADCADFFGVCLSWPDSYRFPGIRDPSWRNSTDHLVVENRRKIFEDCRRPLRFRKFKIEFDGIGFGLTYLLLFVL